ncbi:hypothetical protein [Pigmentiphaga humi]|uniref:hypothetical protein n=1 Tax=Pigmentiphaga humi TaxID=2478468 RepID=UPI000F526C95|nr:hypothetical protein [Pigmentiphaga humi]
MVSSRAQPPVRACASLSRWRRAIMRGNRAHARGEHAVAKACYGVALRVASELYGHIADAEAGTAALVVAYHNLADTHASLGAVEDRAVCLCEAHQLLCRATTGENGELGDAWRQAALRHSRQTYAELLRFLSEQPDHARAKAVAALDPTRGASAGRPH